MRNGWLFTRREQQIIRNHYPNLKLQFLDNGSVYAQKSAGCAYGLLYSRVDARRHINSVLGVQSGTG